MKAVLIDLDGAVFQGDTLVPGVDAWIRRLQASGFPHLFVTNSSARPRSAIVKRLEAVNIKVKAQEILTPTVACAQWLCEHSIERLALMLPRETVEDLVGFEIVALNGEVAPEAIIVGDMGSHWNYLKLNNVFRALMEEPQPRLVALGMTRYWRSSEGLNLDVAPFVKALEFASGIHADVIGKQSVTFFQEALNILGCEAGECAMIGDDIQSDIKGAQDAGLQGILVRTGKFRESDLQQGITPNQVLDSIAQFNYFSVH